MQNNLVDFSVSCNVLKSDAFCTNGTVLNYGTGANGQGVSQTYSVTGNVPTGQSVVGLNFTVQNVNDLSIVISEPTSGLRVSIATVSSRLYQPYIAIGGGAFSITSQFISNCSYQCKSEQCQGTSYNCTVCASG